MYLQHTADIGPTVLHADSLNLMGCKDALGSNWNPNAAFAYPSDSVSKIEVGLTDSHASILKEPLKLEQ